MPITSFVDTSRPHNPKHHFKNSAKGTGFGRRSTAEGYADRQPKRDRPHWGARKIRELLLRGQPGDLRLPAKSTIHAVLDRHGLVKRMGKRRSRATGTPLSKALAPNELWCADFKGEFKLGNGRYCYPLTVTDQASRFLLMCEALETTREEIAVTAFERLFCRSRIASSHSFRQWGAFRQS